MAKEDLRFKHSGLGESLRGTPYSILKAAQDQRVPEFTHWQLSLRALRTVD